MDEETVNDRFEEMLVRTRRTHTHTHVLHAPIIQEHIFLDLYQIFNQFFISLLYIFCVINNMFSNY